MSNNKRGEKKLGSIEIKIENTQKAGNKVESLKVSGRIKYEFKFVLLALILVVGIAGGIFGKMLVSSSYITSRDIYGLTGVSPIINDRLGNPIYIDGETVNFDVFGTVVGYGSAIPNSIIVNYRDEFASSVNPITGYSKMETLSRVMSTTLLTEESQVALADMFKNNDGCCFSYNYETGEVYTMLSFEAFDSQKASFSHTNVCINGRFIPGSTMKIVTTILAADQKKNLGDIVFTCGGGHKLPEGKNIDCHGNHGTIGFDEALGMSCNSYFAQLSETFDLERALKTMQKMGIATSPSDADETSFGRLTRYASSVNITDTHTYKNVWGFVGQGDSQMNPVDMAMIAGAVVNGGKVIKPYVVSSVTNPNDGKEPNVYQVVQQEVELFSSTTAKKAQVVWKQGVDGFYRSKGLNSKITYAKTGTAQRYVGDIEVTDKLLVGVIESSKTAFYIVVKDSTDDLNIRIANKLVSVLPKN